MWWPLAVRLADCNEDQNNDDKDKDNDGGGGDQIDTLNNCSRKG